MTPSRNCFRSRSSWRKCRPLQRCWLIQPQPLWRILLTEGFTPLDFWPTLALGLALLAWSAGALRVVVTPGWLGLLGLNLLASIAVQTAFLCAWGCLAFWAPRGAEDVSTAADRVAAAVLGGLKG